MYSANYDEVRQLADSDPYSGLTVVTEERHVTLPMYRMGSVGSGISSILSKSLYRYRQNLQGVPMAFGNVRLLNSSQVAAIVDDQPCMHVDVNVDFVVFFPTIGGMFRATVVHVTKTTVSATLYDWISMLAYRKEDDLFLDVKKGEQRVFRITSFKTNQKIIKVFAELVPESELSGQERSKISNNKFLSGFSSSKRMSFGGGFDPMAILYAPMPNTKRVFKDEDESGDEAGEKELSASDSKKRHKLFTSEDVKKEPDSADEKAVEKTSTSKLSEGESGKKHKKKKKKYAEKDVDD